MPKKNLFPRFRCRECPHLLIMGTELAPTYFCDGFPGKRKPKRFPRSGPTYPKDWCPKLLTPPVCRLYDFSDERNRYMDRFVRERWEAHPQQCINLDRSRYEVRGELNLGMTAKQFFDAVEAERLRNVIPGIEWNGSEVIEIDDGLRPYGFYVYSSSKVIPVDSYSWRKKAR